ncbi:MAG: hypothetical protein LC122_14250 [Chitinophagales bacterium]|nr:hypothetical protein [Chitinophagales bacterium]
MNVDNLIEYTDDVWLHIYNDVGMTSIEMSPAFYNKFVRFLRDIYRKNKAKEIKSKNIHISHEPIDDGKVNVLFVSNSMINVVVIPVSNIPVLLTSMVRGLNNV